MIARRVKPKRDCSFQRMIVIGLVFAPARRRHHVWPRKRRPRKTRRRYAAFGAASAFTAVAVGASKRGAGHFGSIAGYQRADSSARGALALEIDLLAAHFSGRQLGGLEPGCTMPQT